MNNSVDVLHSSIGWVYVLENKTMPGLVKIGFTKGCPIKRAKTLSSASGVPLPFDLVDGHKVYLARRVESEAHKMLDMFRVDENRELFRVTARKASEVIRNAGILVSEGVEQENPGAIQKTEEVFGGMSWPTCINPGESMPGITVPRFFGGAA